MDGSRLGVQGLEGHYAAGMRQGSIPEEAPKFLLLYPKTCRLQRKQSNLLSIRCSLLENLEQLLSLTKPFTVEYH